MATQPVGQEEEVDWSRSPSKDSPEATRKRGLPPRAAEGEPSAASGRPASAAAPAPHAATASAPAEGLPSATEGRTGGSSGKGGSGKRPPAMSELQRWGPYQILGSWQWHPQFDDGEVPRIFVPEAVFHYKKVLKNRDLRKLMSSAAKKLNLLQTTAEAKAQWHTWTNSWHTRATTKECEAWVQAWMEARNVPIKATVELASLLRPDMTVPPGHFFSGKALPVGPTALRQPLQQNQKATHSCLSPWKVLVLDREPAWWMLTDEGTPSDFLLGWHGTNAMALSHILCGGRLFPSEIDQNDPKKLFTRADGKFNVAHGRGIYTTTDFDSAASFSPPCVLGLPAGGVAAVAHPQRGEPEQAARELAAQRRSPPRPHSSKTPTTKQADGLPSASQPPTPSPPPSTGSCAGAEGLPSASASGKASWTGGGVRGAWLRRQRTPARTPAWGCTRAWHTPQQPSSLCFCSPSQEPPWAQWPCGQEAQARDQRGGQCRTLTLGDHNTVHKAIFTALQSS